MDDPLQQGVLDVKYQSWLWIVAVCGLVVPSSVRAQTPPPTSVAVVDVSKIFEEHAGFKQTMEAMRQEVVAFENELKGRGKEMETIREQMKQFDAGTPEFKKLESQILQMQADGQILATQKKRDLLDREAKVYYTVYTEIQKEVTAYAQHFKIGLVLRYNSAPIDPANRQSVLDGVNSSLVYQGGIDITQRIIDQIAQRRQGARTATPPAAANTQSR